VNRSIFRLAIVILGAAACTGGSDPTEDGRSFQPTYAEVECPDDVAGAIVGDLSCGYLTVLEDRTEPEGRTIRVFFARLLPSGDVPPDPYMLVGGDLADQTNFGGFAPAAERTGRELILIEPRGVGHSDPSLACPEIDELAIDVLEAPMDDGTARSAFLDAVGACHERVSAEGVDPSMYSIDAVAADVVDLRTALGIRAWNVASHGTASRISFEVARLDPKGVRGLYLDTPDVPEVDPITEAVRGTEAALETLSEACEHHRRCSKEFPDLRAAIDEALERLAEEPIAVRISQDASIAGPVDVVIDDARFLSLLRQIMSDGGSSGERYVPGAVPVAVLEALAGRFSSEPGSAVANMVDDQAYCTGFLPKCTPIHRVSYGALLSYLCRDVTPFVDLESLAATAPNDASVKAFVDGPFLEACERWPVSPAEEPPAPTPTDVGALVLLGDLDPYAHPAVVGTTIEAMSTATILRVPVETHNMGIHECIFDLRRTWLEDPDAHVEVGDCGAEIQLEFVLA
jgi:pimeloyl-ACP methyl ester carboxylesterase